MTERCERCGGAASLAIRQHGESTALCILCADKFDPTLHLGGLRRAFIRPRRSDGRCPNCNWTNEELRRTGLYGCPLCYEALESPTRIIAALGEDSATSHVQKVS